MKSPTEEAHKPNCFVIMPFKYVKSINDNYNTLRKDELDTIFKLYVDILENEGYSVCRADSVGDILAEIIFSLDSSDLVLADLTGLNPNVMYELGLRHGFTKKTILTSQDVSELPFDLGKYFCIQYGWVTDKEKNELKANIRFVLGKIKKTQGIKFGPVHTYLGDKTNINSDTKNSILNHFDSVAGDISCILGIFREEFEKLYQLHPELFIKTKDGYELDSNLISNEVLDSNIILSDSFQFKEHKFPAIEYNIARNRIISYLNIDSSMSSFNIVLRNMYRYINSYEYTLIWFLGMYKIFSSLQLDLAKLRTSLDQEKFGIPLKLKSIEILKMIEDFDKWGISSSTVRIVTT